MIMDETKINLDVETQTFRFTPSEPIKHEEAVSIGSCLLYTSPSPRD